MDLCVVQKSSNLWGLLFWDIYSSEFYVRNWVSYNFYGIVKGAGVVGAGAAVEQSIRGRRNDNGGMNGNSGNTGGDNGNQGGYSGNTDGNTGGGNSSDGNTGGNSDSGGNSGSK